MNWRRNKKSLLIALAGLCLATTAGSQTSLSPMPTAPPERSGAVPDGALEQIFSQSFDIDPPTLPAGWVASNAIDPDGILWVTSNAGEPMPPADSGNAAFINDPDSISDKRLDSPLIGPIIGPTWLLFRNNYGLQSGFDGGVLEISINGVNGGAFMDIIAAGGTFNSGGYNATISTAFNSPIAGRMCWSGSSGGFITTSVQLPGAAWFHQLRLRWRMASDSNTSNMGWRIDTVEIYDYHPTPHSSIHMSGTVGQCNNSGPSGIPLPGVTMTLTGPISSTTTTTDSLGNYSFTISFIADYTVAPSKAARQPTSAGIDTVDVLAIQRHFLQLGNPLTGCRLAAADVAGTSAVDTVDAIATQRFFLGFSTGIGNAGMYRFAPASRFYSLLTTDQTGQNYDAIVLGDVSFPFAVP